MAPDLSLHSGAHQRIARRAEWTACLNSQHNLSQVLPSPPQKATNHRSLRSFYQIISRRAQVVADQGLHQSPLQGAQDPRQLVVIFRLHQSTTQLVPKMTYAKGRLGWYQNPTPWGLCLHNSSYMVVIASAHSHSVLGLTPPTVMQTVVEAEIQQESTNNSHRKHLWSTQLR